MNLPLQAIGVVARSELRRRWRSLVVIGLIAGVVGAVVTSSLVLARRTSTAYDRLAEAVHVEDARVQLFGTVPPSAVEALPGVRSSWNASLFVGKVRGEGVNYLGIISGPPTPPDLFTPIVVEGRNFDADDPFEAVIVEHQNAPIGLGVGDEVGLKLLTPEEVAMFDTGFGEPDGPAFTLRITGVVRTTGSLDGSPLIVSPAFEQRFRDMTAASSIFLRLDPEPSQRAAFAEGIARLNREAAPIPGAEEFPSVTVTEPTANERLVRNTSRVLVGGLLVFALVAGAVGLLVLAQVFTRHHAASAEAQRVEAALGLTAGERVLARVLPASLSAGIATAITVLTAVLAGHFEPWGAMRKMEPSPGFAPNLALALVGGAVAALVVVGLSAAASRRAGSESRWIPAKPSGALSKMRALTSRPTVLVGTGLALGGASGRSAPMRSSLVGASIGVAGLVASFTFAASIDQLADSPARYGWAGDLSVIDVNETIVDDLLSDERFDAVAVIDAVSVEVDGRPLQGYSYDNRRGKQDWWIIDGRTVEADGEVVLGRRAARLLGLDVGDRTTVRTNDEGQTDLTVVGVGVGPNLNGERFGESVLITPRQLETIALTHPFSEAMLHVVDDVDPVDVFADLAPRYETFPQSRPTEVANLVGLEELPEALGIFLGAVAVLAMVHALVVTTMRRANELAIVRVLGAGRNQVARSVAIMAVTISAAGLLVGVPVGYAVGRLVWWAVADAVGVAPDAVFPLAAVAIVSPLLVVIAVFVAWLPAHRSQRSNPAAALRAE